jgi:hypothetical protein
MMHKSHTFRSQAVVRTFAFACFAGAVAGCTATGQVTAPAQSTIEKACTDSQMALSLASFVVKTSVQQTAVKEATTVIDGFCTPSALAAEATPAALAANVQALETVIANLNTMSGAASPVSASGVVATQ